MFYHHTPAGDHLCGTQGGPWLVFYSVQGREQNMIEKVEKKKKEREQKDVGLVVRIVPIGQIHTADFPALD